MAEFTKQHPPRGWSPKSPRLTIQGLQSLRLAMQQDTSSTAAAASYAITMAQDHNETPDPWTTEQSVRRSNTQQWVQQLQQQQSQSHWDIIPTDPMFRLEGDPQLVQQANPQAVSPQLSQDEIDAEERTRPENEIDSKFGSDVGLGIYKQVGVRKAAAAADTATSTKSNVHDHNHDRRGRYKRLFSSADTTAVNSTGSKSGNNDALVPDVIQDSKTESRSHATAGPQFTASSSIPPPPPPPSAIRCRHYHHHAWKRMCSRCYRQREVDAVIAVQPQQQQHQQAPKQTHRRRPVLAPLILQTISTSVKVMGQVIADVVRDAENYIMDTYIHQLDDVNNDINHNTDVDDGVVDEDEVAIQSRPEHCPRGYFTDETPCPGVSLTALRAAVGVLLCIVVWIFARIAALLGPERLFGVCLVAVLIFVGRGQSCAREVTATHGVRDTGDDAEQSGHKSYLSDTSV